MRRSLPFKRQYPLLIIVGLVYLLAAIDLVRPPAQLQLPTTPLQPAGTRQINTRFWLQQPAAANGRSWATDTSPKEALAALDARVDGSLTVSWDAQTGVPRMLAAPAGAALPYTPSAAEAGNPLAIAQGFLDENRALFRLQSAAEQLPLLRIEPDPQLGFAHVRLAQHYQGLPVFGKQLVVHLDAASRITAVNGQIAPELRLSSKPTLTREQAEQLALTYMQELRIEPDQQAPAVGELMPNRTELVVYVDPAGKPTLSWVVTMGTMAPFGSWKIFVNARRPVVVHAIDRIQPIKQRATFTAGNSTRLPGRILIEEGQAARNDDIAQAAHDGAGVVYDYYQNTFNRDAIDGQGGVMVSTVNYGSDPQDAENAAWVGELQQMIYGDGGRIFRPLPFGLDVVGHEFTHGIVDATSQLMYEGQSGALNESYADVFGAMIDRANWTIGEEVVKSPPFPRAYLRSMEDPNAEGAYDPNDPLAGVGQPANMDEFANLPLSRNADNGGVHINSGIPNHAAFLVAQAISKEKMEQIYFRAVTQYLTPNSQFVDAANASIQAATELFGQAEADAVRTAFGQVGIGEQPGTPQVPSDSTIPSQEPPPPPPAEQLPAGCTELLTNGNFEAEGGWVEVVRGNTRLIDTELPYTGQRGAWLGGTDQEPLQILYQEVRIPANAVRVELRYWRLVHQELRDLLGVFAANASFTVLAANEQGDLLGTIEELNSSQGDDTWAEATYDVSQLAGKTVRLAYAAENPRGNVSSFFVDDVRLTACTSGEGPAAPTPASGDEVFLQGTISDADTGRGVESAQVFVLMPGLSAADAAADDNLSADEVATLGVTDGNGFYQTETALPRGQAYSVIVVANGYRPILADDGVSLPVDAANPFQVDATLRRGR